MIDWFYRSRFCVALYTIKEVHGKGNCSPHSSQESEEQEGTRTLISPSRSCLLGGNPSSLGVMT